MQGQGFCRIAKTDQEIRKGIKLHNQNFPEFTNRITFDWVKSSHNKFQVWIIDPIYIKYWDDELYKDDEFEEFNF